MKFLMIVLLLRFLLQLLTRQDAEPVTDEPLDAGEDTLHPAEFSLREEFSRIEVWF